MAAFAAGADAQVQPDAQMLEEMLLWQQQQQHGPMFTGPDVQRLQDGSMFLPPRSQEANVNMTPTRAAFSRYGRNFPQAHRDYRFQAKHRTVGGWVPTGENLTRSNLKQCEGCPECMFGTCFTDLTAAQKALPRIVAWEAISENMYLMYMPVPPAEAMPMRFAVGDDVMCRMSHGWSRGNVVAQFYVDAAHPPGFWVPYQVRLLPTASEPEGALLQVPGDTDAIIMSSINAGQPAVTNTPAA